MITLFIPWYEYFEFLSLLMAIIYYTDIKKLNLLPFIPLLLIVCLTELAAAKLVSIGIPTYTIYNYYLILTTPFYFYIFYNILNYNGLGRYVFLTICLLIFIFILINFFYLQGNSRFNTFSLIMIEFIKAIMALLTLLKLFDGEDTIKIYNHPFFWISAGTLIFSLCSIVILGLQQLIEIKKVQIDGKNIYRILQPIIIAILYTSYCYAFYLCRKLVRK